MLSAIRHSKLVPAVLSALIVLGMWSNAMAAVFCPHMIGSSDCCLMQKAKALSHDRISDYDSLTARDQMDHMHMSDAEIQAMPMDMAGVQMSDMQMDHATASQPQLDRELLSNVAPQITPNDQLTAEAVTQPNEPCSHCMMHSRSGANAPLGVVTQNNNSYRVIPADLATAIVKTVPSSLTFLDLHDHSPPGSNAARYVLNTAFRI